MHFLSNDVTTPALPFLFFFFYLLPISLSLPLSTNALSKQELWRIGAHDDREGNNVDLKNKLLYFYIMNRSLLVELILI